MQFKRFRKAYGKYRKFAKKMRPAIVRANKTGIKTVWRAVNLIRKELNVEKKYWDQLSLVAINCTHTAPVMMLPWDNLDQGTLPTQRVGDQVKALWTQARFTLDFSPATMNLASTAQVRIMAVLDTEPRGGAPFGSASLLRAQLLQYVNTGPLAVMSPYNTTQASGGVPGDRFKILKDFKVSLDNVKQKQKAITISLNHGRGIKVKYAGTYPAQDRLYILVFPDNDTAGDIVIDGQNTRFCFVDN